MHVLEEHPTPFTKYEGCGSQVPPWHLGNHHYDSKKLRLGEKRRIIGTTLQHCFRSSQVAITLNAEPLELVAALPYPSFTVIYNNSY